MTLFHDLIIPLGVLAVLGKYFDAQLSIAVITALLTIIGYCINNTVVVFDRVREQLADICMNYSDTMIIDATKNIYRR